MRLRQTGHGHARGHRSRRGPSVVVRCELERFVFTEEVDALEVFS